MNKIIYILVTTLLIMASCSREQAVPVVVDFKLDTFKGDYSIPVQVVVINKTVGADTYEWKFDGAVPGRSVKRNPGFITYNAKGAYTVELVAGNQDGSRETKTVEIQIDDPVVADFSMEPIKDTFSPAVFTFTNMSSGASGYQWTFEGGTPSTSDQKDPGTVSFKEPGGHRIVLEVSNTKETYELQKTITVAPYVIADFDVNVAFEDDDLEIPVKTTFTNSSVSATSYRWTFEGAEPAASNSSGPEVSFIRAGTHTITLTATNGKESKSLSKEIIVTGDTNMRTLTDVRFGINTAHNSNTVGSFYGLDERKLYTAAALLQNPAAKIDLVFFGLSSDFGRNKFVSPDNLEGTTFMALQNGKNTRWINSQELCNCSAALTANQFDQMTNDTLLNSLEITETLGGVQVFDNKKIPRIVLFQTQEGKKGAIKIKKFIENGNNSFILADIKVQKKTK